MGTKIVLDFVEAVNSANVDRMYDLMAEDHQFIDSQDNKVVGKEQMRQGWIGYFALFPDFKIEINEMIENSSLIYMFGYTSGTYQNLVNKENSNHWRTPSAWRVLVENDLIRIWQVYADNIVVMDIMNRNK